MRRNYSLALWLSVPGMLLILMGFLFMGVRSALDLPLTWNPMGLITGILPGMLVVVIPIAITMHLLKKTYPDIKKRQERQYNAAGEHPGLEHHLELPPDLPPATTET